MQKKLFILGIIAVIAVAFAAAMLLNKDNQSVVTKPQGEEEGIKNDNADAVKKGTADKPAAVRPVDDTDHILGSAAAPVKMIIYSDFECPFCANFTDTVRQAKEEFGDKAAIVFRHFPLERHRYAVSAAIASECAAEQGKFWEMHDKIFAANKAGGLGVEQFKKDAVELGLDSARFNQCLDSEKYKDKIQGQLLEGKNAGVTGTPTSFINGEIIIGAYPMDDFTGSDGVEKKGMRNIIQKYLK